MSRFWREFITALESQKAVKIRGRVLGYFQPQNEPADLDDILDTIGKEIEGVADSDVRDVTLRLTGAGKLMYTPD
jgi:hypothetical protein